MIFFPIFSQFVLFYSYRTSGIFFVTNIESLFLNHLNQFAHSNGYNIFIIHLINNSVCISSTFILMKTKGSSEYALYLVPFFIVLNVKLC